MGWVRVSPHSKPVRDLRRDFRTSLSSPRLSRALGRGLRHPLVSFFEGAKLQPHTGRNHINTGRNHINRAERSRGGAQCMERLGRHYRSQYHDTRTDTQFPVSSSPISFSSSFSMYQQETSEGSSALCSGVAEQGNHQGSVSQRADVLFPNVFGPQARGKDKAHHRPVGLKQAPSGAEISDGDIGQDCGVLVGSSVGYVGGHHRRLLACSNRPQISKVLRFRFRLSGLCFSGGSLWAGSGSLGILKDPQTSESMSSQAKHLSGLIPQRFPGFGGFSSKGSFTHAEDSRPVGKFWFPHKLGKVIGHSCSEGGVSGRGPGPQGALILSTSR